MHAISYIINPNKPCPTLVRLATSSGAENTETARCLMRHNGIWRKELVFITCKLNFFVGLEARLQQIGFDRARLQAELGGLDPVAVNLGNRLKGDAGFGLAYTSSTLQVGVSVSQLVQSRYKLYEVYGTAAEQSRLYRHFYLHGAYTWQPDATLSGNLNTASVTASPTASNTAYIVEGTDANGCVDRDTVAVILTPGAAVVASPHQLSNCKGNQRVQSTSTFDALARFCLRSLFDGMSAVEKVNESESNSHAACW